MKSKPLPCKKCSGGSSNFLHNFPIKNLLPKSSVGINVPYLARPISYGENSTHSGESKTNLNVEVKKYFLNAQRFT